jgi:hypothetical protein
VAETVTAGTSASANAVANPLMNSVYDVLPGQEVPVADIGRALARLWDGEPGDETTAAPSEFRASQMNLVLHLGLATDGPDAEAQFATALRFAQRYPCRLLVLCPRPAGSGDLSISAKIFSQCYIGPTRQERSCCEAVLLTYPQESREFLEDQVSIVVESDLPLYYWAHRFSSTAKLADYRYLLRTAQRFVLDSALVPPDALTYAWPRRENLRDLCAARLLPVRQALSQHLSGVAPAALVAGLNAVRVGHSSGRAAEGAALAGWLDGRLRACGLEGGVVAAAPASLGADGLSVAFDYADGRHFRWVADLAGGASQLTADWGHGPVASGGRVRLLAPEAALAEALFF